MSDNQRPRVIAVIGATATGKTGLAIELALRYGGEVISADSRQVYRGLDLGTGKVTSAEARGIHHHLIDVADPSDTYTVDKFRTDALAAIEDIRSRGKLPILCGGTGMYVDSVLNETSIPDVPRDLKLRAELKTLSTPTLFERLHSLDPRRAESIDRNNPPRLIRAIEIATALGAVPLSAPAMPRFDALVIGCRYSNKAIHAARIETRVRERIEAGMFEEALRLRDEGLSLERMRELGLEYRHLADWIEAGAQRDAKTVERFVNGLCDSVRAYARRQTTWFKRRTDVVWIDMDGETSLAHAIDAIRP